MTKSIAATAVPASRAPRDLFGGLGLVMFSALALAPAVLAALLLDVSAFNALQTIGFSVALWAFWVALWGKPLWACLAAIPFVMLNPVLIYLICTFHAQINPAIFGIILETNPGEARQFLQELWLPLLASYGALLVVGATALSLLRNHPVRWQRRWWLLTVIGLPVMVAALHASYSPLEKAASSLKAVDLPFRTKRWPQEIEDFRSTSPFGVSIQIADALQAEHLIDVSSRERAGFRFGAHQTRSDQERQVYVLIIGESSRRDRWTAYGYERPTSPRLQDESNLVAFGDVVTVAPMTRLAVPVLLTRKPSAEVMRTDFPERSLVSAFREAGFATYWVSNQAPIGIHDATYAAYAKEADHLFYFNVTGGWAKTPDDGVMLNQIRRILATASEPRQLIVIHTMGNHIDYRERYPSEFDMFKPSLATSDPALWHDAAYKAKMNNAYDNSILFADHFIHEVIESVQRSGRPLASLLFVSDHGEDLYDLGCNNSVHGHATTAGLRIPMFFWYSAAYARVFSEKISMLRQNLNAPLTSEAVFPLMLDAADIHFPTENNSSSVLSSRFKPSPHRYLYSVGGERLDYDRAHLNKECLLVN